MKHRAKQIFLVFWVSLLVFLPSCASYYEIKSKPSGKLVEDSISTLKTMKARDDLSFFKRILKNSAGCAIFPALYKAGFFVGAEGGNGLLIARDENGEWGSPAFYTLAGGSWGLQFGAQKAGVVLVIRSRKAVEAILKHQGKFGGDIGLAIGPFGAGVEGSITSNLAADIYAFSDAKGLFGGASLEGTAMIKRNDLNEEYYGNKINISSVVFGKKGKNPRTNQLRSALLAW